LIVVTGHLRVAPENAETLKEHAAKMVDATRKEKGCLLYAYGEDIVEPGMLRIVERWQDWDSLAAHGRADHMGVWRAALDRIGVTDRDVWAHETSQERKL
jgi:quinol monooxygenase YgiN